MHIAKSMVVLFTKSKSFRKALFFHCFMYWEKIRKLKVVIDVKVIDTFTEIKHQLLANLIFRNCVCDLKSMGPLRLSCLLLDLTRGLQGHA